MDDAAASRTLTARAVPAKTLAVPSTVSPQLQRSISNLATAPRLAPDKMPVTADEWRAFIARADAQTLSLRPILEELFPHTLVKREIAGVTVREITPSSLDPAKAGKLL